MAPGTESSIGPAGDPADAIRLGVRLQLRGDHDDALKAFRDALDSGDPDYASEAGLHLGALLHKDGDLTGAATAYEQALATGHPDHAPKAAVELGDMLTQLELHAEAKAVFEYARTSRHPDHSPRGALQLGRLLERTGDAAGAQQAYRQALDSGHPYQAPPAAMRLGALLRDAGDATGARNAFQLVVDIQHPDHAEEAAAQLKKLPPDEPVSTPSEPSSSVAEQATVPEQPPNISQAPPAASVVPDEREGVWRELAEGIAARNVESVEAANRYGQLLLREGDREGAERALRLAAESGHWEHGPAAALELGQLLLDSGDHDGANVAYQSAIDSNHPDHAPGGAVRLGNVLARNGDPEGARKAYQQAIATAHSEHAPDALCHLGELLGSVGDAPGARRAYEQAIESGHPHHAPQALLGLAIAVVSTGDPAAACTAYQRVIESGHPEHAPAAAHQLGTLLTGRREVEAARVAYQQAIDSGHAEYAPASMVGLGILLHGAGDPDGARQCFRTAINTGHPEYSPDAAVRLDALLADAGKAEQPSNRQDGAGDTGTQDLLITEGGHLIARSGANVKVFANMPNDLSNEAATVEAIEEAVMAGVTEMSIGATPTELPLMPVLFPADWNPTSGTDARDGPLDNHVKPRPLMVAGRQVATVTFARHGAKSLFIEPVRPDTGLEVVEADAFLGLTAAGLGWQDFTFGDDDDATIDMRGVLECTAHPAAASGVLDASLLRDAHRRLGTRRIIVAFPARRTLIASRADLPPERIALLARVVATWNLMAADPVSHLICYATDGVLDGIYKEGDAALAELRDVPELQVAHEERDVLPADPSWLGEGDSAGPLLPILQPMDWESTVLFDSEEGTVTLQTLTRPLLLAGRHVGFIAYGRHRRGPDPTLMVTSLLGIDEGLSLADAEESAMANFRDTAMEWFLADVSDMHEGEAIAYGKVLVCWHNPVAASGVLAPTVLREAQELLNCAGLVVGMPSRDSLYAAPADLPPNQLESFALEMARIHLNDERPVTPLTFYTTDGVVHGIYEGSDRASALRDDMTEDEDPQALFEQGSRCLGTGDFAGARDAFQQAAASASLDRALYARSTHNIGVALVGLGDIEGACSAYSRAAETDDPDIAPQSRLALGWNLMESKDLGAARQALETAIAFDHPMHSNMARAFLGILLGRQGDYEGAERAYLQAIDSGDVESASQAGLNLGEQREQLGDLEGARRAYQQTIELGSPKATQTAACVLAQMLYGLKEYGGALQAWLQVTDQAHEYYSIAEHNLRLMARTLGDRLEVRKAFREAAESEDPAVGPRACNLLGTLLRTQQDTVGSRAAFQRAVGWGQPEHSTRAQVELGVLLRRDGDAAGARDAFEEVLAAGHPETASFGAVELGLLLASQGEREGAQWAYQVAVDSDHAEYSPVAAQHLGRLLACPELDPYATLPIGVNMGLARTGFEQVVQHGSPQKAPVAAVNLGVLLTALGDTVAAKRAYQIAVDSGHTVYGDKATALLRELPDRDVFTLRLDTEWPDHDPDVVLRALENLVASGAPEAANAEPFGDFLLEQKDFAGARRAYRLAVVAGRPDDPFPHFGLGRACLLMGDLPGAKEALQRAIDTGHAKLVPAAAVSLGLVLKQLKDYPGATQAFQRAIDSDHAKHAPEAAEQLGRMLEAQDDIDGAEPAYQRAIDFGPGKPGQRAAFWLGQMLLLRKDYAAAEVALRRVTDSELDIYPSAAYNLGAALAALGDLEGARKAIRVAQDLGKPDIAKRAREALRVLANS